MRRSECAAGGAAARARRRARSRRAGLTIAEGGGGDRGGLGLVGRVWVHVVLGGGAGVMHGGDRAAVWDEVGVVTIGVGWTGSVLAAALDPDQRGGSHDRGGHFGGHPPEVAEVHAVVRAGGRGRGVGARRRAGMHRRAGTGGRRHGGRRCGRRCRAGRDTDGGRGARGPGSAGSVTPLEGSTLEVNTKNATGALGVYERLGFVATGGEIAFASASPPQRRARR